jgi:hypothetical protein
MLNLDGNAQKTWYEPVWTQHHIGRKKSVETVHLPSAVDEVIDMGIAPYVKTLKFSPAFYVDGMSPILCNAIWHAKSDLPYTSFG